MSLMTVDVGFYCNHRLGFSNGKPKVSDRLAMADGCNVIFAGSTQVHTQKSAVRVSPKMDTLKWPFPWENWWLINGFRNLRAEITKKVWALKRKVHISVSVPILSLVGCRFFWSWSESTDPVKLGTMTFSLSILSKAKFKTAVWMKINHRPTMQHDAYW